MAVGKDFEKRKVLRRKKGKFSYATEEDKTRYGTNRADSFKSRVTRARRKKCHDNAFIFHYHRNIIKSQYVMQFVLIQYKLQSTNECACSDTPNRNKCPLRSKILSIE